MLLISKLIPLIENFLRTKNAKKEPTLEYGAGVEDVVPGAFG